MISSPYLISTSPSRRLKKPPPDIFFGGPLLPALALQSESSFLFANFHFSFSTFHFLVAYRDL